MGKRAKGADAALTGDEAAFPIVGIGASAGGLAAFEAFFSGIPAGADPAMAFVLVQHLDPDHKSILAELVQRRTRMRVGEAADGMRVEPGAVYIIPPGRDLALEAGALRILEPSMPRGRRLPIDFFFGSLARALGERAIGVVLSGTGADGSLGLRAIKGAGGMTMAQSPESAEHAGMPRAAVDTGLVDFALPPGEMPAVLAAYAKRTFAQATARAPAGGEEAALKWVFALLRAHTGHDFSQYKPSTLLRRLERRMTVRQVEGLEAYVALLRESAAEVDLLFRDLLIGVTNFFRDAEYFGELEAKAVPRLFDDRGPGSPVRAWVAGCSTGEEAYSVAILLHEQMEALRSNHVLQVFATDIDARAIATARAGLYPAGVRADISPERLARYFRAEPEGGEGGVAAYRVDKRIRDLLIFSEQDLIKDPPFSRLDLICCRNLMIYLGPELQKRLVPLFHYALNPGGYLFLGSSETVGGRDDLFEPVSRKARIFRRKDVYRGERRVPAASFLPARPTARPARPPAAPRRPEGAAASYRELAEQALLRHFAPCSALVNRQGDIFYIHGRTGLYLEPAPGEAGGYNVLKMAREGLAGDLALALREAADTGRAARRAGVPVRTNGGFTPTDVGVCPATGADQGTPLFLVILEEARAAGGGDAGGTGGHQGGPAGSAEPVPEQAPGPDSVVAALRAELREKELYLQTANEELETSNEELKSANEELQSVNEELQSANEELETSKEELQSANEELSTLNGELQAKVQDLGRANNDMNNLLSGTGIATIFVDRGLRLLRFTPAASAIMNLIPADVGRPVAHIVPNLVGYADLAADAAEVLRTLVPREIEVAAAGGRWYAMRILPYRTLDDAIEGAVITFSDVTDRREAAGRVAALLAEKELVLKEVGHRIKNYMSNIAAMLSLQEARTASAEARAALRDSKARVLNMMLLYRKLYEVPGASVFSLKHYIAELAAQVAGIYPLDCAVRTELEVEELPLDAQTAQQLGIVVNELMTNAFKYAFAGRPAGRIAVKLGAVGARVRLEVSDDGVGLPARGVGADPAGFGLELVETIANQLGGSLSVSADGTAAFVLEFAP